MAAEIGQDPGAATELVRLPQSPATSRGVEFHYAGCGCGSRPWCGDLVDWIWTPEWLAYTARVCAESSTLRASLRGYAFPRLRIGYLIPHHNVTGGMKMIMAQIQRLHERGHWVKAVFRGPPGSPVLPPWAPVPVAAQQLLALSEPTSAAFHDVDVTIIGYFTQLIEWKDALTCPGPILYWEQGHEHVFGDPLGAPDWDRVFHDVCVAPIPFISVSNVIRDIMKVHFARSAPVVPNAIDCAQWYPTPASGAAIAAARSGNAPVGVVTSTSGRATTPGAPVKRVLIVGNPGLKLKNFETALHALNIVHEQLSAHGVDSAAEVMHVTWIAQVQPSVSGVRFPVTFIINPPQADLPSLFADGYDAFLFTSVYEAWGMPVLEAMAAGVPVITSLCHGVDMFCKHGWNCFMAEPYDAANLAAHVLKVLRNPEISAAFSRRGRRTAEACTWGASMTTLECALTQVYMCLGAGTAHMSAAGINIPSMSAGPTCRSIVHGGTVHSTVHGVVREGCMFAPGIVRMKPVVLLPGHTPVMEQLHSPAPASSSAMQAAPIAV